MNFLERQYRPTLWCATVLGMLINAWSTILAFFHPLFKGLLPYGGSEEAMYLIRTQEALLHPFTNVTNGVWSGAGAPYGLQSAGAEQLIGALFFWTGVSAPWVVLVLHVLIAPLMIPLFAALARRVGATKAQALLSAVFLFWLFVYGRRLFHPGFSLPLVLVTLLLLWRWYELPTPRRAIALGVPLGFSVGVYLWAWTFLWTTAGLLVCAAALDKRLPQRLVMLRTLPWLAGATLLAGGSAIAHLLTARLSPFFAEASVRAGLVHTRWPESPHRSVVIAAIAVAAVWIFRNPGDRQRLRPLIAAMVALAVMYNQQALHGTVISFSSHYIHYVSLALVLLVIAVAVRKIKTPLAVATCFVCAGMLWLNMREASGRAVAFLAPPPEALSTQHLQPALALLQKLPKATLLSDRVTADVIGSYTRHDVAFTEYSAFLLTSDKEYVDRACLSELFAPEPVRYEQLVVHAEERLRVLRGQEPETEYLLHLAQANAQCSALRGNPLPLLKQYGITHLLWDKRRRPEWKIDERLFQRVKAGDGWSLWKLQAS